MNRTIHIEGIHLMVPRVITAKYLDSFYMYIYDAMYIDNYPDEHITKVMSEYIKELAIYLRFNADTQVPVISVRVHINSTPLPVLVQLTLSNGKELIVELFRYQSVYKLHPVYTLNFSPDDIQGTMELGMVIHGVLGYLQCNACHYSDTYNTYCGLGVGMYTGECQMNRPRYK